MDHTEDQVDDYIKGMVTAGLRLWKYEASEEVAKYLYYLWYLHVILYLYYLWYNILT